MVPLTPGLISNEGVPVVLAPRMRSKAIFWTKFGPTSPIRYRPVLSGASAPRALIANETKHPANKPTILEFIDNIDLDILLNHPNDLRFAMANCRLGSKGTTIYTKK